jgi:hypothetical protein
MGMSGQLQFISAIIFRERDSKNQWAEKWMVLRAILDKAGGRKIHNICAGNHSLAKTYETRKVTDCILQAPGSNSSWYRYSMFLHIFTQFLQKNAEILSLNI